MTQDRIILASLAKLGRASMTFSGLMGSLAAGTDMAGMKAGQLGKFSRMVPDQILKMDPDNFAITYDQIATFLVEALGGASYAITLVTDRAKFQFEASRTAVDGVRELMASLLGQRLEFRA